jgi:hypothetical protein
MNLTGTLVLIAAALAPLGQRKAVAGTDDKTAAPRHAGSDIAMSAVVSQPLAHARELVALPGLPGLFGPPYQQLLTDIPRPDQVRALLEQTAAFWPDELVVTVPRSSFAAVDSVVRAFIDGALVQGARAAGAAAKRDLSTLQGALTAQLRKVQLPSISVSAHFANASSADIAWRLIGALAVASKPADVKVSSNRDSLAMRFRLAQVLDARALAATAVDLGWASAPGDAQAKAIAATVGRVVVETSLARDGARIEWTVGPRRAAASVVGDMPAIPIAVSRQQMVVTGRWDLVPVRAVVAGWLELWAKWQDTPAGKRARARDDSDLLGDIDLLSRDLAVAGDHGEAWLWADHGVHAIVQEHGTKPLTPLAGDRIGTFLPAELVALDVSTGRNLGELLSHGLDRVENRLAFRSMRHPGEDADNPSEEETREAEYYKTFAQLRELIHRRGPALFDGSSAVVMGAGTRIARAELRLSGRPPATLKDVAVPEVAAFGRARDANVALAFVADAWVAVGQAVAAMLGRPAVTARLTEAAPFGAGATVRWLDSSWLDQISGESVSFDSGFKPHVAFLKDMVVLSTSPSLTRKILSLDQGSAAGRLRLPLPDDPLVAWTRIPCAPFARQTNDGLIAIQRMFGDINFGTTANPRSPKAISQLFDLACEVVTDVTETATQKGSDKATRYDATAASRLYRQ